MRILVTRPLPDVVIEAVAACGDVEVRTSNTPLTMIEARAAMALHDIILPTLGDAFSAQAFDSKSRTKLLANFGVGYNHIDVAAAKRVGVVVSNTPGAVTEPTADIALMLILMSARRAGEGERLVRAGKWEGWHPTQMLGLHLAGKTLGVVGMGRIGQAIAQKCRLALGMRVKYYNRSIKPVDGAVQVDRLTDLAAECDVLVAATPGGAATRHTINADVFAAMPAHGHFVNISRGDVVDEAALIAALQTGQIAGAGLDVYEHEPKVPEALRAMPNVVLLPHLGTAALEVRTQMGLMAASNIKAFTRGDPLPNAVS